MTRIPLLTLALFIAVPALVFRGRLIATMREFFNAADHPLNLAIFRIALFFTVVRYIDVSSIVWFSELPQELRFAPIGLGWLLKILPINHQFAAVAAILVLVFGFTAMIGLFSRTSAALCVIFGLYALGIPQFYGKINHYHHLLWFAALLAVSPCGDALSIDAIRKAWRRADAGETAPPGPAVKYARPLRFVWLLIGFIYFFPGIWKLGAGGLPWIFSENLKLQMHAKWMQFGGWTPFFRIDQYPFLYKGAAIFTILFEVSAIFLVLRPVTRRILVPMGLLFHNSLSLFMGIAFYALQACYASLVNWHWIFRYIGKRVFSDDMFVLYDGNCRLCRRVIATIRAFDLLERVIYINALDEAAMKAHGIVGLKQEDLLRDLYVISNGKQWTGAMAYRSLAVRIPFMWPFLPALRLPVANKIYRRVADSRACSLAPVPSLATNVGYKLTTVVGVLLLTGNFLCGIKGISSWPFACYPVFHFIQTSDTPIITLALTDYEGNTKEISLLKPQGEFVRHPERLTSLIYHILHAAPRERQESLRALCWVFANNEEIEQAQKITIYKDTFSTAPEKQHEAYLSREVLDTFDASQLTRIRYPR